MVSRTVNDLLVVCNLCSRLALTLRRFTCNLATKFSFKKKGQFTKILMPPNQTSHTPPRIFLPPPFQHTTTIATTSWRSRIKQCILRLIDSSLRIASTSHQRTTEWSGAERSVSTRHCPFSLSSQQDNLQDDHWRNMWQHTIVTRIVATPHNYYEED